MASKEFSMNIIENRSYIISHAFYFLPFETVENRSEDAKKNMKV